MKSKNALLSILVFLSVSVFAQEKKVAPKKSGPTPESVKPVVKSEKEISAAASPGQMHEIIIKLSGDWSTDETFKSGPGAQPEKSTGKSNNEMIMQNRFLRIRHHSMTPMGEFEGEGLMGYDNLQNTFQFTWIDNMSTGMMNMKGSYDSKTNSITLTGTGMNPQTGLPEKVKQIFKFADDGTIVLEIYGTKNNAEYVSARIVYTR